MPFRVLDHLQECYEACLLNRRCNAWVWCDERSGCDEAGTYRNTFPYGGCRLTSTNPVSLLSCFKVVSICHSHRPAIVKSLPLLPLCFKSLDASFVLWISPHINHCSGSHLPFHFLEDLFVCPFRSFVLKVQPISCVQACAVIVYARSLKI